MAYGTGCKHLFEDDRKITTLTAHNARLKAALVSIVSSGEKSEPYENEYHVMVRDVSERDYQAAVELIDAPCGREAEDGE